MPYKYNETILEDGVEIPIQPFSHVENIVEASRVTHSGRVFAPTFRGDANLGKKIIETYAKPKKVV